jgi:hypothetical protein
MARDFKLNFRFGSGVLGASVGNVALPGTNVTAFTSSFTALTGTAFPTGNTISNQLVSCPMAWGGWTNTSAGLLAPYAEDIPNQGTVLGGHASRNDMFCIVDCAVATTLVTAANFAVQASDDLANWITIGTGDQTLTGAAVTNGTVALTLTASTSYPIATASAAHGLQVGDLLVVTSVTNVSANNGHESVALVAGNVVEVVAVPSTTTFAVKYPGPVGTTLKSNTFPLNAITLVAGATPALTFTKVATSGSTVGAQIIIPLGQSAKPYIRLAVYQGASAAGYAVIRDAYLSVARTGIAR